MKFPIVGALALVFVANPVAAGAMSVSVTSLSELKLSLLVLQESERQQRLPETLVDTMRPLTWDESNEAASQNARSQRSKPAVQVEQPGLGGPQH